MKKLCALLALALTLTGCGKQQTVETVNDVYAQPASAARQQVVVQLPQDTAAPVMESDAGTLYICESYTISQQILEAGDLKSTVRSVSGFAPEELKIVKTRRGDTERYDFVWTAAGETGEQVCRACILDNGSYHYVLTATADASQGAQVQDVWREMFNSFRLVSPEVPLYTGS